MCRGRRFWVVGGIASILAGVVWFLGCGAATPPDDDSLESALDPDVTGMASLWMYYPVAAYGANDRVLAIDAPAFRDTVRACADSTLSIDTLRMPPLSCTVAYELDTDTLRLHLWTEGREKTQQPVLYEDSTAVVVWRVVLARQGNGVDLVGRWDYAGLAWQQVRGELTEAETAELDSLQRSPGSLFGRGILPAVKVEFSADSVWVDWSFPGTAHVMFGPADRAPLDTSRYNVTLVRDAAGDLTVTGDETGESVTIAVDSAGTITYTSTDSRHAEHTFYEDYRRCPNEVLPAWFGEFLTENERPPGTGG